MATSKRSKAKFCGVIRLIDAPNTIGIPIFSVPGVNFFFIPLMDDYLRISQFAPYDNETAYKFCYDLPDTPHFSIGDPAPIPFWVEGELVYVISDTDTASILASRSPQSEDGRKVIADVAQVISKSAGGYFAKRSGYRKAREIKSTFRDVFLDTPSHARYWVTRFKLALRNARSEAPPPHPIDESLRSVGRQWLSLYGTKTDYPRIRMVLGDGDEGIFSREEIQDHIFGFLLNKAHSKDYKALERLARTEPEFLERFPQGLYYYGIKNPLPTTAFKTLSPDLLNEFVRILQDGADNDDLDFVRRVAVVLFGNSDTPNTLGDQLRRIQREYFEWYRKSWDALCDLQEGVYDREQLRKGLEDIVSAYDGMVAIDAIEYGDARLTKRSDTELFGIDPERITDFRAQIKRLS